jgi:Zn-dependent M28 family amino/carboxypeptidase
MRRLICLCVTALLGACGQQQATDNKPAATPARAEPAVATQTPATIKPTREGHFSPEITAADFAAHVQRLSSDEFEGRKPGSIGERMTTTYLVDQFQGMGLKPGNGGSYLQRVPMVETTLLDSDKITLDVTEGGNVEKFAYRADTILGTWQDKPEVELKNSDLVFAGYGVVAPEYQWNDYAGLDVKGKTVIVLVNDPGFGNGDETLFKGNAMTYYGRWTYKFEEAARQGAAGCLIVHETAAAAYPWEVVVNSWSGPQFNLPASEDPEPRLLVAGWLTTDAARRLFAGAGADFDAQKKSADLRGFKPSPLAARLSTQFHNLIRNTSSDNAVALLPGSKRPDEVIIYSAHWDHLGRSFSGADRIFNGAIDNASGVAAMLEIADAFAHQQPLPERSILFLAPTLEEAGLLGSRYYSVHPTVPLTRIVADINMDALQIIGRTHDMAIVGYGQSQMDDYLKDALAAQQRVIVADAESEKGFFYRSDQLNFARVGVPVLYANSGYDKLEGGVAAGRAAIDDYTRNRYHKPSDEYDPNWDLAGVIENIQALHAVGKRLADESTFPQWNADSEFRAARETMLKAGGTQGK